jgi:uncharacterized membrane protein YgcG
MRDHSSYLLGLDILGAVTGAARTNAKSALPRGAMRTMRNVRFTPEQAVAAGEAAVAAGQRLASSASRRLHSGRKIAQRAIAQGQKAIEAGNKAKKAKTAAQATAAARPSGTTARTSAPSATTARTSSVVTRTAPTAARTSAVTRGATRVRGIDAQGHATDTSSGPLPADMQTEAVSAEIQAKFAVSQAELSNILTEMTKLINAADAAGKQDLAAEGADLANSYSRAFLGPEFQEALAEFKPLAEAWKAKAGSPAPGDTPPTDDKPPGDTPPAPKGDEPSAPDAGSAGGGGGGGGGEGGGEEEGGGGGGGGGEGEEYADEGSALTDNPEVAKFRESGGEYDPFAEAGDEADPFAEGGEVDESAVEEAQALATVLGIDFKWQYIFLPHLAIQDAVEERSHGPMMTLATPVAAPAKKATATPATLKKLAFSKGRLEETRRKIADLQRQQAAEDAQDQATSPAPSSQET